MASSGTAKKASHGFTRKSVIYFWSGFDMLISNSQVPLVLNLALVMLWSRV